MGFLDNFNEAQMFALGDKIAKNGLSQAESSSYRCENCRSSQENNAGYLSCGYHGIMVLATQTCDEHTNRPGNSSPPPASSPSPSYSTPSRPSNSASTGSRSRAPSKRSTVRREFYHRVGAAVIGATFGALFAALISWAAHGLLGKSSDFAGLIAGGSYLLFTIGMLIQGWKGELDMNRRLEAVVGGLSLLIIAVFIYLFATS